MVQRKAARYAFNDFSSYSSASYMLSQLHWQSLEERTNAIIIMFYKAINNLICIDLSILLFLQTGAAIEDASACLLESGHFSPTLN